MAELKLVESDVPGMEVDSEPDVRLADCCPAQSASPRSRKYVYVRLNGEWYQCGWFPTAKANGGNGKQKIDWLDYGHEADFCQNCGTALNDKTPTHRYWPGEWSPLDDILKALQFKASSVDGKA